MWFNFDDFRVVLCTCTLVFYKFLGWNGRLYMCVEVVVVVVMCLCHLIFARFVFQFQEGLPETIWCSLEVTVFASNFRVLCGQGSNFEIL